MWGFLDCRFRIRSQISATISRSLLFERERSEYCRSLPTCSLSRSTICRFVQRLQNLWDRAPKAHRLWESLRYDCRTRCFILSPTVRCCCWMPEHEIAEVCLGWPSRTRRDSQHMEIATIRGSLMRKTIDPHPRHEVTRVLLGSSGKGSRRSDGQRPGAAVSASACHRHRRLQELGRWKADLCPTRGVYVRFALAIANLDECASRRVQTHAK